jgi:hypothetical protein
MPDPKAVAKQSYEDVVSTLASGGDLAQATMRGFADVVREELKQLPEAERFLAGLSGYLKVTADKDIADSIRNGFGPTFKVMVANVMADVQDVAALLVDNPSLMAEWKNCSDYKERARLISRLEHEGKLNVRQAEELCMGWTGHRVEGYLESRNG